MRRLAELLLRLIGFSSLVDVIMNVMDSGPTDKSGQWLLDRPLPYICPRDRTEPEDLELYITAKESFGDVLCGSFVHFEEGKVRV